MISSDESYLLNLSNILGTTTQNDERRRVQEQLGDIFRAHLDRSVRTVLTKVVTTPTETPQAYVMVSFLLDFFANHGKELCLHQDSAVTSFITDTIVQHLTAIGLGAEVDSLGRGQSAGGGGGLMGCIPWNIRWARKLATLLGVSTALSLSASEEATIKIYNACISDLAAAGHLRATLLFSLHNLLKTYESKRMCKAFKKASSIVAPSLSRFLQSSAESSQYDWAIMVLKIMVRVSPIDYGDGACNTGMLVSVVNYLDIVRQRLVAGVQEGDVKMCMLRSVEYGLKVLEKVIGNLSAAIHPESLNTTIIGEILTTSLGFIYHSPTVKCFLRCVGVIETVVSFGDSSAACAAAITTAFPTIDIIYMVLLHTAHYLVEEDTLLPIEELLRKWDSKPETYFDELELLSGGDSSEAAAESLFTALSGSRSDGKDLLFLRGAWQVINQLLDSPASLTDIISLTTTSGPIQLTNELSAIRAKVLAYRIMGLGHYSMSEGQEENYKSFFNQCLIPDISSPNPLVQRRAIWVIGMWCEATDHTMRLCFFTEIGKMLCSGSAHLVIVLTALRAIEHFVNDSSFHPSDMPDGMLPMLLRGLETVVPSLESPLMIQSVAGLIYVLLEKTSTANAPNDNVPQDSGVCSTPDMGYATMGIPHANADPILDMFVPTITKFLNSCASEKLASAASDSAHIDDWDDGAGEYEEEDDKKGAMVSAMFIVLEVLGSACWRASDDKKWAVLMPLVSFLTNSDNIGTIGHQLVEEGWGVFVSLVYTTAVFPSQQLSAPYEAFQFAMSQLDRDLDDAVMVKCTRVVTGLYSFITGSQWSPQGQLSEEVIWKLCQHCSKHIDKAALLSPSAERSSTVIYGLLDVMPAVVELAIVISFPVGDTSRGSTNPIVQSSRQYLFDTVSKFILQTDDNTLERYQHTPILVGLYAILAPLLIAHKQQGVSSSPPQLPEDLARRLSIIIDITTSLWVVRAIGVLCERLLADCMCTADEKDLLNGVMESCTLSLAAQEGEHCNSGIIPPRLEAMMEAFENGGLKMCPYTERLGRCGVFY